MKKKLTLVLMFFTSTNLILAQNEIDPRVAKFANEVYLNCPQYAGSQYFEEYSRYINQVSFAKTTDSRYVNTQFPLLSSVGLKNKCNYELKTDQENFNQENFNPLKYFFDFEKSYTQIFQIENTDVLVIINPKNK